MFAFILPFIVVFGALLGVALGTDMESFWWVGGRAEPLTLIATLFGVPVLAAYAASELIMLARARRAQRPGAGGTVRLLMAGAIAAVVTVVGTPFLLVLSTALVPDALVLGAVSVLSSVAVLLALAPARAGHCVGCGYDLRDAVIARCPECGSFKSAA